MFQSWSAAAAVGQCQLASQIAHSEYVLACASSSLGPSDELNVTHPSASEEIPGACGL